MFSHYKVTPNVQRNPANPAVTETTTIICGLVVYDIKA